MKRNVSTVATVTCSSVYSMLHSDLDQWLNCWLELLNVEMSSMFYGYSTKAS